MTLDDFRDVEADFLNWIEEEFENQLDYYVDILSLLIWQILIFRFAFMFNRASGMLSDLISMAFNYNVCLGIKNKNNFIQFYYCNSTSHVCIVPLDSGL